MDGLNEFPSAVSQLFILFAEELINRDCHNSCDQNENSASDCLNLCRLYQILEEKKVIVGYPN